MQLENSEQALLSCLIKNGELIKEVSITSEHFGYTPHKKIFEAMLQLDDKDIPIDVVSVSTEIGEELIFIGGTDYLSDLYSITTNEDHIKAYEKYVLEEFKIRKTKELVKSLEEIHSPKDIRKLQQTILEVNDILEEGQDTEFDLDEVLYAVNENINKVKDGINGIPTGFVELDHILDGLGEEELIILGARPSVGKTAVALGITINACQKNNFVNFFSLEMSDESLVNRMISNVGNINSMKMKNALQRFNDEDWNKYSQAQGIISKFRSNLYIVDQSKITVQEIRSKVKQSMRKFPDLRHLVVIDYLTLIQGSGRKERHLEVGEISRNLKRMARDLKVPVLLLAQLSRAVEQRRDKRPMLSDLRDSGEIEQDADKILFLHRDDYYDREAENKNIIEVIAAKNRNGALGTVSLAFIKEYNKFINLERKYDG